MSTVSIKPAASGRYTHKYNPMTVMSMDFGMLGCSRYIEVEKSDKWNVSKVKGTLRLAPQVFPAYGKNTLKSAAFFVRSKDLFESYDQMRNNKTSYKGKSTNTPNFDLYNINSYIYTTTSTNNPLATVVAHNASAATAYAALKQAGTHWDLIYYQISTQEYIFMSLTYIGRRFYSMFKQLGYDFAQYDFSSTTSSVIDASAHQSVNALPLLAYCKIYVDYFLNPHFYNTSPLVHMLQRIHDLETYTFGTVRFDAVAGVNEITQSGLELIFSSILVPYEHNMYLDAWNSPNSPDGVSPDSIMNNMNNQGWTSPFISDITDPNGQTVTNLVVSDSNASYVVGLSSQNQTRFEGLSYLGQNFLQAAFRFVKRNNLFGSKPVQEFFARFGIKDSDWNSTICTKLYEGVSEIDYSAVVSQTDSVNGQNGKTLGSYAGFGVSGLNFSFNYKASDPGYILVVHWIQITPILVHGIDPMNLRLKALDFYTPEFDGKGIRAIPQMEISQDKGSGISGYNGPKKIYGFTDIYDEYRNMRDMVVGDFVTDTNGANNFVFARDLSYFRELSNVALQPQTNRIQYYGVYGSSYDVTNPFQWYPTDGDRFYLEVKYEITANRSISSKSAALDLNGEGDMQMQIGGSQMR